MASVLEITNQSQIKDAIERGFNTVSEDQVIVFNKYDRYSLPADGYVFYIKDMNEPAISVGGSLHYSTDQQQRADETIGINRVLFTTQEEVNSFNDIERDTLWIGQIDDIRFCFTKRTNLIKSADTYHYQGDAIYPAMYSQIIDDASEYTPELIATNSLPLWLAMNEIMSVYTSYLVPSNILPPYAVVDVERTEALQSVPYIDSTSSSWQLLKDQVKITIYGLDNDNSVDYLNYILNQSYLYDKFGVMNMPFVRDEKRTQSELGILAMKKSVAFDVSYYQSRVKDVAIQLILEANLQLIFE